MTDTPRDEFAHESGTLDPAGFGAPDALASGPERPARGRKLAVALLPVVLVVGAVSGTGLYLKSTVEGADTTVSTTSWGEWTDPGEDPAGELQRGRSDNELSKLLLPVPQGTSGYRLGPDVDEFGNDSSLTGRQATAQFRAAGKGLTGSMRKQWNKRVEKLGLQGVASRSYVLGGSSLVMEITVSKMKDRKALRSMHTFSSKLFTAAPGLKPGPKIKGHKDVTCARLPVSGANKVEDMFCSALQGDVLVTFHAYAGKPMSTRSAADLLKDQLDHIDSPGEYV